LFATAGSGDRKGHDYHVGVEGPDGLHAQELETHAVLHRLGEGVDAGLGGAAKLAGLGGEALGFSGEALGFEPGEQYPGAAAPIGKPLEGELGKAKAIARGWW
jgi:hypothetical protein